MSTNEEIKVGDVVVFKSGGIPMTVGFIDKENKAFCYSKEYPNGTAVPLVVLKKVEKK
jgi:uncharacterized protein YodC (DUF2158 family)